MGRLAFRTAVLLRPQLFGLRVSVEHLLKLPCIFSGKTCRFKHAVSVFSPAAPAPSALPLSSKLMSSMGSTVLVTLWQRPHTTSLCNCPAKVEWMMQLHETFVEPREVLWM